MRGLSGHACCMPRLKQWQRTAANDLRAPPDKQGLPAWQSGWGSLRSGTRIFPTTEARMAKKCARCAYGATNERDAGLSLRHLSPSLVSSLEGCAPDVDDA